MSSNTSVSVVIPCYNGEKFLRAAILSAKNQSYKLMEIIVIDDGSTDNSLSIANDESVTVIKQKNQGVSRARNTGLNSISSDFVIFLDADDILEKNAVQYHLESINGNESIAVSFGSNYIIDEEEKVIGENLVTTRFYNRKQASSGTNPGPSQCMYRVKYVKEAGGFNPELTHGEDVELLFRLLETANAKSTALFVVNYRTHPDQATKKPTLGLSGALRVLEISKERKKEDINWEKIRRETKVYYGQFIPIEIIKSLMTLNFKGTLHATYAYIKNMPYTGIGTIKFLTTKIKSKLSKL